MTRPLLPPSVRAMLTALALFAAGTARAEPECQTPAELRAAHLRQLHQEMQVAALKCAAVSGMYEEYVARFGGALSENARVLKQHFARNSGTDGQRQFDRYLTRLANNASSRSHYPDYCAAQEPLFEIVLKLRPEQVEAFAVKMIRRPDELGTCTSRTEKKARPGSAPSPG